MRIELVPVFLGLLVLLLGGAIIWDSRTAVDEGPLSDRRRRRRAAIDLRGETFAGGGIALLGVALINRDGQFETLLVLSGALLLIYGAVRNRRYFKEVFFFRGAARRGLEPPKRPDKLRIR